MKSNLQINKQEQVMSSEYYNFVETPPDIIKAKQHGVIYYEKEILRKHLESKKLKRLIHQNAIVVILVSYIPNIIYFVIYQNLSIIDRLICTFCKLNNSCFYFQFQGIIQLLSSVIFLPYSLYYAQKGDQCDQLQICGEGFWKRYSIWNQITDSIVIDDLILSVLYSITTVLSSVAFYFMDFGNMFKPFLSNQLQLAFLNQSVMIISTIEDNSQIENQYEEVQHFKAYDMNSFKDQIMNQILIEQPYGNNTKQIYCQKKLQKKSSQINFFIIIRFQFDVPRKYNNFQIISNKLLSYEKSQKDEFCDQNKEKIILGGIEQYFKSNFKKKSNCCFILNFIIIIFLPLFTTTLLALNLYIQYEYLPSYHDQQIKFVMRILFSILSLSEIHLSNYIAQQLIAENYQIQIYFMVLYLLFQFQVISLKNFNKLFEGISNQEIYLQEYGIIDNLIIICFLNIFLPSLSTIFDMQHLIKQLKKIYFLRNTKNNLLQLEANKLFEARSMNFQSKLYRIFQICLLAQIFVFDFPFILPLTLTSLFITYWVDKYFFVKKCIPKLNKWDEDQNIEIQKQQFQTLLIMNSITNFILFNISLLLTILIYLIGFNTFSRKKVFKVIQSQKEIKPSKLYKFIQQYNSINIFGDEKYIKHQYLYELFILIKKKVKKNLNKVKFNLLNKKQRLQVQSEEIKENLISDI